MAKQREKGNDHHNWRDKLGSQYGHKQRGVAAKGVSGKDIGCHRRTWNGNRHGYHGNNDGIEYLWPEVERRGKDNEKILDGWRKDYSGGKGISLILEGGDQQPENRKANKQQRY